METMFQELEIVSYISADTATDKINALNGKPVTPLKYFSQNPDGAIVIVCDVSTHAIENTLEKKGLRKGKDYIRGLDLIKMLDQTETFYCAYEHSGKKIIVMGCGYIATEMIARNPDLDIAYFVDNDVSKHDKLFFKKQIFPVEALKNERPDSFVVIVATTDYGKIKAQLIRIGLSFGDDFYFYDFHSAAVQSVRSIEESFTYYCAMNNFTRENPCHVVVVGTGLVAYHLSAMERLPIVIDAYCCTENDIDSPASFQGAPVVDIEDLDSSSPIVLLADFTENSLDVLKRKEFEEGRDYFFFRSISSYSFSELLLYTICDTSSYERNNCDYMTRGIIVSNTGDFASCSAMNKAYLGNVYCNSINKLLRSVGARIAWVSIVNRTYSFCLSICGYISRVPKNGKAKDCSRRRPTMPTRAERINICYDPSCNLVCPSCRSHIITSPQNDYGMLDLLHEEVIRVLPDVKGILNGNGEAFVSRYMQDLYFGGGLKTDELYILTNGLLFRKYVFERLKERYSNIKLSISIDAATNETYWRLRRGDFDQLLRALRYAGQLRRDGQLGYLSTVFTVQKPNFREMKKFIELSLECKADKIFFKVLTNRVQWTIHDFLDNDVFNVDCPYHAEFLDLIQDPVFTDPRIHLPIYNSNLDNDSYCLT